ncbi:MAG TPA: 3-hydroxyacyl-CoA dehydrogenase [Solimonas sp.]|nr:3-hydroxyacyl-CoA dehydrogenase [Solimonas sp.]
MSTKPKIGVVGAGAMGRGIVQLFAQSGHAVAVFDSFEGAVPKAVTAVTAMIEKGVEKKTWTRDQADAIVARIHPCAQMAELADCEVVIEAIVEDIAAKQALFAQLEGILPESAILASNTSSLVIAEIAARCRNPQRVAGLHFFNPVPLMKVVEVIAAVRTSAETVRTLRALVAGTGHRAVVAEDQPGFLVNHAGRGLYTEGLRVLEERVATVEDVDTLLREALGFRMGPFELLDLTGLDVSGKVMESIYEQFQHEPRFRPSSLVRPRIAAGLFGRKSGCGWYGYDAAGKSVAATQSRVAGPLPSGWKVWIDPKADECERLQALVGSAGALRADTSADADLLIVQPWGWDATGYAVAHGLDAGKLVAVDPLPGLDRRRTLMLSTVTNRAVRDAALALLGSDGVKVTLINDSPGFVLQRILATIVNIAANIAQRGIASIPDIEDAVKLGLGYPMGPLSWGDRIGGERILSILRNLQSQTGDPRYRPSPWLLRRAQLARSLLTPEAEREESVHA